MNEECRELCKSKRERSANCPIKDAGLRHLFDEREEFNSKEDMERHSADNKRWNKLVKDGYKSQGGGLYTIAVKNVDITGIQNEPKVLQADSDHHETYSGD